MKIRHSLLLFAVFVSGMASLGTEMAASRLLAPYFGTSIIIWANLIGLILIYLTVGYYIGGRLADRHPNDRFFYQLTAWAGFTLGLIPVLARPILGFSLIGFAQLSVGIFYSSLVGVIILFAIPMTLLGCVSPFAIRLLMKNVEGAGNTAGSLYALSTVGSIAGTFLAVLVFIPNIGTHSTLFAFSGVLLATSIIGLISTSRAHVWRYAVLLAVVAVLATLFSSGTIRAAEDGKLLYEGESAYNYIQVVQRGDEVDLVLNEGHAIHSIYNPNTLVTNGPWDYFLLAPYFYKDYKPAEVKSASIIGLAAGTMPKQYTAVYGPIPIDGVEIDPRIIEVGRKYFAMNEPNLNVIAQDGRYFLQTTDKKYDVIGIDAYHQPYIPFQLTTREFFSEVRDHLNPRGSAIINVGRTPTDFRLVDVIAGTMKAVFPHVYVIDVGVFSNSMVIGTNDGTAIENFATNLPGMTQPFLHEVATEALSTGNIREVGESQQVFTDDWAPVEAVIDQMILNYVQVNK